MSRKDENLKELAGTFYGQGAKDFVREMDEAERMFRDGDSCEPESEVIDRIKSEVIAKCKAKRRNHSIMRIWQVGAVAASILAMVILWNAMENKPAATREVASQVWNEDIDEGTAFEAQVSAVESNGPDLLELVFDVDGAGSESELESELTELSGSFWEG